jgi:hypothetical protein
VQVRYNRRLFQEFHSRQPLQTRFRILGFVPLYTLELQQRFDPFQFIAHVMLKDGTQWTSAELKRHLFRDSRRPHPEGSAANFRAEIEERIDYLITVPANIQVEPSHGQSIGPWDFEQSGHADRRELRGACLLAAWLGWFDSRFENTRLRVREGDHGVELLHYFTDLGAVLGQTSGFLHWRGEQPNAFPWTFTRAPEWRGPRRMARPFRIVGFEPIEPTPAFAAMTVDDARWMARWIGQIREAQLIAALVAAGYDSAEVRLYTEKLISRRDRMIVDLGLAGELPPLRSEGANHRLDYDPAKEGAVTIHVPGSGLVRAPLGDHQVKAGRFVSKRNSFAPALQLTNSLP